MSLGLAALLSFSLIALLFAVASLVEARAGDRAQAASPRFRHLAYTLGLGVYCSSWTFYGAVGSIVREGWNYLPIYLAPCVLLIAAPGFLNRLADAVDEEKAATISDFIAARFGHDTGMARLVTLTALSAIVPYVALQLRSIGIAIALLSDRAVAGSVMVAAALVLGLFAILFGARRYELAGRTEGMLFSIALESVIKLVALVVVAGVALAVIAHAPPAELGHGLAVLQAQFRPSGLSIDFAVIALISALAVVVLPRQFFMGLAQARGPHDLRDARWGAAGYIAAMAVLIVPIALAGLVAQWNVSPKLAHSGNPRDLAIRPEALAAFVASGRAWFKFVIATPEDVAEVAALAEAHALPSSRILLMPEGRDTATLRARMAWLADACLAHGYGLSDRLHIHLSGDTRGT